MWSVDEVYGLMEPKVGPGPWLLRSIPVSGTGIPILGPTVLSHRFAAYVPTRDRNGIMLDETLRKTVFASVKLLLVERCGGCTVSEQVGTWIDQFGTVMEEPVSVIESYNARPFDDETVRLVIGQIGKGLNQDTVTTIHDNYMKQWAY